MKKNFRIAAITAALLAPTIASAEILDRPSGIKIGSRLTLRPYVALSATYDSNVNSRHNGKNNDVLWTVAPGLGITYSAERWEAMLQAYYNYRSYCKGDNVDSKNRHSYGEDFRWNWTSSENGKGWSLVLDESFQMINESDDLDSRAGRGSSNDSWQFNASAAAQRRFNEYLHADVNAGYYQVDYDDSDDYGSMFGWQRWLVGAEAGFAPSQWTDFIVSGSYMGYQQDNNRSYASESYSSDSQGYQVQMGIGSYMTKRISYRALCGWSRFEYGDSSDSTDGFVYTVSGNWKIGESWNTMLLATSYYQPSEREYNSASRVDGLSWGVAKSMVRGKLRATLDVRYRRETQEYMGDRSGNDYTLDTLTGRLGLSYTLNRFMSLFSYAEYQKSWNDDSDSMNDYYDYDRWRITCGVKFTY